MNYPNGATLDPSNGNYNQSGKGGPVVVGSYPANGFGFFDMQGSVVEWVWDFYDPDYYEVLDTGWFAEDALPDGIDPGHILRIPEAFRVWRNEGRAFFRWLGYPTYCN